MYFAIIPPSERGSIPAANAAEKERRLDMLRFQIDDSKADLKTAKRKAWSRKKADAQQRKDCFSTGTFQRIVKRKREHPGKIKETIHAMEGIGDMDERMPRFCRANDAYYSPGRQLLMKFPIVRNPLPLAAARLEEIEDRLALIAGLRRKYGSSVEEILSFLDAAQEELEELEGERAELSDWKTGM